jgi:hypothetical protein
VIFGQFEKNGTGRTGAQDLKWIFAPLLQHQLIHLNNLKNETTKEYQKK